MGFEVRLARALGIHALDIAFATGAGLTAVFGPSGAGKTSLLNMIAGVLRPDAGRIAVGGAALFDAGARVNLAPEKRRAGYIFQDGRLFPHLSVRANLLYGAKLARGRLMTLDAAVDFLGIGGLLDRRPATLSGGEAQRVAIGRALLGDPAFLLMDEPLASLDRERRGEIMAVIERLRDEIGLPILYVSHDIAEVERLADHLVLLGADGTVSAAGEMATVLTDLSLPLARTGEAAAVLRLDVERYDAGYDISECRIDGLAMLVPGRLGASSRLRVRASDVSLVKGAPAETSVLNLLPARIVSVERVAPNQMVALLALAGRRGDARLIASVTRRSWDALALAPGDPVIAQIKAMALVGST